MKKKPLRLFNGRPYGILPHMEWNKGGSITHLFIAAYSIADLRRLCVELGLNDPGRYEINEYWNKDAWGTHMDGIEPERGLWIKEDYNSKPERILFWEKCASCERRLVGTKYKARTHDGKVVDVGYDCYLKIRKAGWKGYHAKMGWNRLFSIKKGK